MKYIFLFFAVFVYCSLHAQDYPEKEIKTEVNAVTVFIEGAQVTRTEKVTLAKGITVLKFTGLSPFIDAKSVQLKASGPVTVLGVNHQQNYLQEEAKSAELKALEQKLETLNEKIQLENTHLAIIREELEFLNQNRVIGGKNEATSVANLQQAADFYASRLKALKMEEIDRQKTLRTLHEQEGDIERQIRTITSQKEFPAGEILAKVEMHEYATIPLELSYVVGNTGWFPSYDIRAENINEPVQLIYKANVQQDTKEDWDNVKLTFSSSNPNVSGVAPELQPYYLNFNSRPPVYGKTINSVRGRIFDAATRDPLSGATVQVEGSTIGTVADMDGNYQITIPSSSSELTYSYIGYISQTLPANREVINVALEEDEVALEEVVVVGYGNREKRELTSSSQSFAAGVKIEDDAIRIRGVASRPIPVEQDQKQTTVSFEISKPYTIKSNNKNYSVDMAVYALPAYYQYYSVPKIDRDAFLLAHISNWEQYNLMEGEANIFFENTYIGKTLLDVRYASDTLEISLGRDKNIAVKREKIRDYTSKQFIGSKKEEKIAWQITVKNNKNQEIDMIVLDQVPVSTVSEIEVEVNDISRAKFDEETGEVKWDFTLKPGKEEIFTLKYNVKSPKQRHVFIE